MSVRRRLSFAAVVVSATASVLTGLPAGVPASSAATLLTGPLHVQGNTIRDSNNAIVTLQGLNRPGLEYETQTWSFRTAACPQPYQQCHPFSQADVNFIAGWGANVVRVPVSEDFWNQACTQTPLGYPHLTSYDPAYRQEVRDVVSMITAKGMLALIDLHSSQRKNCDSIDNQDMGGSKYPVARLPLPDKAGAVDFWTSVANDAAFKNKNRVAFELWNEPHICGADTPVGPGTGQAGGPCDSSTVNRQIYTAKLWENGGLVDHQTMVYNAAGMKTLYDTVRGTGATNLVFIDANAYATDPTVFGSLNSATASYSMFGTTNAVYVQHFYPCADPTNSACLQSATVKSCGFLAPLLDGFETTPVKTHPVVIDEIGWPDPSSGTELQNVVSHLKTTDSTYHRGFLGWTYAPAGYDPDPQSGYRHNPFTLNAATTLSADDSDTTQAGLPLKHAMKAIYPTPAPC
jgi:cellulase (glycosyl hydrolase family 5)